MNRLDIFDLYAYVFGDSVYESKIHYFVQSKILGRFYDITERFYDILEGFEVCFLAFDDWKKLVTKTEENYDIEEGIDNAPFSIQEYILGCFWANILNIELDELEGSLGDKFIIELDPNIHLRGPKFTLEPCDRTEPSGQGFLEILSSIMRQDSREIEFSRNRSNSTLLPTFCDNRILMDELASKYTEELFRDYKDFEDTIIKEK